MKEWLNERIELINKLYEAVNIFNNEKLSKEERVNAMLKYFIVHLYYDEFANVAKQIFGSDEITETRIKTRLMLKKSEIDFEGNYVINFYKAYIIHDQKLNIDVDHQYTAEELKEMIDNRQIVIYGINGIHETITCDAKEIAKYHIDEYRSFGEGYYTHDELTREKLVGSIFVEPIFEIIKKLNPKQLVDKVKEDFKKYVLILVTVWKI